ncbi:MAG: aspartate-semialdehyde dehydrogenase [Deltaproteobacteria bacterium]|nr:MAG: aspartate-semialdehyde dehydrogenase [Deltaproteobacteria bacterium]
MTANRRERKRRVAVVGATGIAGQQFMAALADHPWFTVTRLGASERSAGKRYGDALRDASTGQVRWWADGEPPANLLDLRVEEASSLDLTDVDLVFSAVESDVARVLEPAYAETTPVVSTASAFRYEDDVPLVLPGVNMEHVRLLRYQQRRRGWRGFVLPQPNCTVTGLAITLQPLHRVFGLKRVSMVSMQGISGAGRSPGVAALDAIDNIIPFIPKEEEKVEIEARKLLGRLHANTIEPAAITVSATCTRAAVLEGHTEAVSVELAKRAGCDEVAAVLRRAGKQAARLDLPSMPDTLIRVHDDPFRPQPRLDRDAGDGMTTSVGRIRRDPAFRNGIKYVLVSHNTKMGAAKGAILVAEYLVAKKFA